uniref:CASP-like protein n=1 Tax=Lactuca sativa TaxID=4236 RepID=A0A9R1VGX8_LACSA|nr:hypothetical protein LSAT_V11C500246960 [Lactuca sativa]
MASYDTTFSPATAAEEPLKRSAPPQEYKGECSPLVDVALRVLLFLTALVSIIVMVTSNQTKLIPLAPGLAIRLPAKFQHSPAFIYFVVALSVACLYSIITVVLSLLSAMKPSGCSAKMQFHFVMFDAVTVVGDCGCSNRSSRRSRIYWIQRELSYRMEQDLQHVRFLLLPLCSIYSSVAHILHNPSTACLALDLCALQEDHKAIVDQHQMNSLSMYEFHVISL